ncbi:TasA family protein [Nocardioides marmotae]|uniref:TasA family protein n=1 Tax=Nocardioides marmotae TaxID=2663857 RepID=UPI0012B644CB|nr:TasA family protein [Nocardioides marmotae]MBC9733572.1 hypothetical protein [Nocardioides marmotae]MTB84677.1 hypothetical protein [Nocardioides marmotae]
MKHAAHRLERPPRRRRTAIATAALLGAVVVLMGGQGTFAFWTDRATVSSGDFQSGSLDITVNGQLAGPSNNGGSTTLGALALQNMLPGESVAASFPVKNVGSLPLVYDISGTGTGALAGANGLQYSVAVGVDAANTGTVAGGDRRGSCGATVATDQNTTRLTATPSALVVKRSLGIGASETICVVARLNSNAGNDLQGKPGSASLVIHATQVAK